MSDLSSSALVMARLREIEKDLAHRQNDYEQAALDWSRAKRDSGLREFVRESNRIENIVRDPTHGEIEAHERLLSLDYLTVPDVVEFVAEVAGAPLRSQPGMNVRVGSHMPPPGGPEIYPALATLLAEINESRKLSPFEAHVRYETLHPFLDGNGRSGRAIWAWQMADVGHDPFLLSFLRSFYYQSLQGARSV